MGMYDEVIVKDNPFGIPYDKADEEFVYQTKDFECNLNFYTFTPEGRIVLVRRVCEYDHPEGESFSGEMEIYTSIRHNKVGITWIEFQLTVEYGQVTEVKPYTDLPLSEVQRAFDTQVSVLENMDINNAWRTKKKPIDGEVNKVVEPVGLPAPEIIPGTLEA